MIVYHIPILVGKSPRISFSQYPNPKYCLSLITVFVLLSWYSHISPSIFFPSLHFRRLDEQLVWVKLRYPKKIACTIIYYHHLSYTYLPIMVPQKSLRSRICLWHLWHILNGHFEWMLVLFIPSWNWRNQPASWRILWDIYRKL